MLQTSISFPKAVEQVSFRSTLSGVLTVGITKSGAPLTIDWGDGTSSSDVTTDVTHTYPDASLKRVVLTATDHFAGLTKLHINAANAYGNLQKFASLIDLTDLSCWGNNLRGPFPSFDECVALSDFDCDGNLINGLLPSFGGCIGLVNFDIDSNAFQGALPSFNTCTLLDTFIAYSNLFTGALPSFAGCMGLQDFVIFDNQFAGALPSFNTCVILQDINVSRNLFTGTIPTFAACLPMINFYMHLNQFSGYTVGCLATQHVMTRCWLNGNLLNTAAVNAILHDLVTNQAARPSNTPVCEVDLSGQTPAAPPSGQGATDKATLITAGWTVTTD